ncbi:MAG: hypothetical protein ACOY3P_00125 [Planctomycetota bacterium]
MDGKPRYLAGYAVIRVDDGPVDSPSRVREVLVDGVLLPAPGPSNVSVKEVLITAAEDVSLRGGKQLNLLYRTKNVHERIAN